MIKRLTDEQIVRFSNEVLSGEKVIDTFRKHFKCELKMLLRKADIIKEIRRINSVNESNREAIAVNATLIHYADVELYRRNIMTRKDRSDQTVGSHEKKHGLPPGSIRNTDGRDTRSDKKIGTIRKESKKEK